jgi:hypothetical protein
MKLLNISSPHVIKLVQGLIKISKYVINQIINDQKLDWTFEIEKSIQDYIHFLSNVYDYVQQETHECQEDAVKLAISMLEIPVFHFQTYRKLYATTYSSDYWNLSSSTRKIIETFYSQEEIFSNKVENMSEVLRFNLDFTANEIV